MIKVLDEIKRRGSFGQKLVEGMFSSKVQLKESKFCSVCCLAAVLQ